MEQDFNQQPNNSPEGGYQTPPPVAPTPPVTPISSVSAGTGQQSTADKLSPEDKVFASLAYISVLFVVPLILKGSNKLIHFHAKQGMVLFGAEVVVWFLLFILQSFVSALMPSSTLGLISLLSGLAWLLFMGLSLASIYFIFRDKKWEIPFLARLAAKVDI